MAIAVNAWKDDKGRFYGTPEEANRANLTVKVSALIKPYIPVHHNADNIARALVSEADVMTRLMAHFNYARRGFKEHKPQIIDMTEEDGGETV